MVEVGTECIGVHLAKKRKENLPAVPGPALLVLCKLEDIWERIGFGWVNQGSYTRFDKNGVPEFADDDEDAGLLFARIEDMKPMKLIKSWQDIRIG